MIARIVGWNWIVLSFWYFGIWIIGAVVAAEWFGTALSIVVCVYLEIVAIIPFHLCMGLIMLASHRWLKLSLAASYLVTPILLVVVLAAMALAGGPLAMRTLPAGSGGWAGCIAVAAVLLIPWVVVYRWIVGKKPPIY